MSANFILPPEFVTLAHRLADAASLIIKPAFRNKSIVVETKFDHSPVTAIDRAAEEKMRAILSQARSGDSIMGEEFGGTDIGAEFHWILDPIDGTKAFTLGRTNFGCLIGLHHIEHGFVLGIADQPITGDRWVGVKGQGATRNGQRLQAGLLTTVENTRVSITNPLRHTEKMHKLHDAIQGKVQFMHYGGDFLNYTGIADGAVHLNFETEQKIYDVAALIPIITEAGGVMTEMDGTMLMRTPKTQTILAACTPQLHAELLKLYKSF
jgi:inositol-phosphate phosphatase/L-galactose 1-phosphate phosphatase/histidinol-phosphatase